MIIFQAAATSQSIDVQIVDDTGLPVTGLTYSTFPSLTYSLAGANADVAITLASLASTTTAYSSGGVVERGNGFYRLDLPNTALATAGIVTVRGEASGKHLICEKLAVVSFNPYDAVHLGLSCLPNTAVSTNGSLITAGSGTNQLTLTNGVPRGILITNGNGTATAGTSTTITLQTAIGGDNYPNGCLISITGGTGSGQTRTITGYVNSTKVATVDRAWNTTPDATSIYIIVIASGPALDANLAAGANLVDITGTAITSNAQIAAAFSNFFNQPSPTGTVNSLPSAIPGASGGVLTSGTGSGQLSVSGGGLNNVVTANLYITALQQVCNDFMSSSGGQPGSAFWVPSGVPVYNGKTAWANNTNAYNIWWDSSGSVWVLSATQGTYGSNYYTSSGDESGPWTAHGSWSGTPVFTVLRRPSSGKNPTLATVNSDGTTQADIRDVGGTAYGGTAGKLIDLAQVANPTQTLNLSGTTISTSQVVASVTATVAANLTQIMGSALSGTAANIAAAFSYFFNVATAYLTVASKNQTGDSYPIVSSGTYGNNALLTAIQNVQNNTFIATSIPQELALPASGSVTINIAFQFSDSTGAAKNLDTGNPTIVLVNDAGTDRSSRLGSWTNPSTGQYVIPYTSTSTDTLEGLHWTISGTINSVLRKTVAYTQLVDTINSTFTSTDRTNLNSIVAKLPTNNIADQTLLTASIGSPLQTTGDFSSTQKASITTAATAATPTVGLNGTAISSVKAAITNNTLNVDASGNASLSSTTESAIASAAASATTTALGTGSGLTSLAQAATVASEISAAQTAIIAAVPSIAANAAATAAAILATPANKLATDSSGDVTVGSTSQAAIAAAAAAAVSGSTVPISVTVAVPSDVAVASQKPNVITAVRGDTLQRQLPELGNMVGWSKVIFTAKANPSADADSAAVFQIVQYASGGSNGLIVFQGSPGGSNQSLASLSVTDSSSGLVNLQVAAALMAQFTSTQKLYWDCCWFSGGGLKSTPVQGVMNITLNVTQTES